MSDPNGQNELDDLRKKRLSELQGQIEAQKRNEEVQKQVDAQRQMILQQILESDARQRLATIKLTRPDLAAAVEDQLIQLYQAGRIKGKLSDEALKRLLGNISPKKRDTTIKVIRK